MNRGDSPADVCRAMAVRCEQINAAEFAGLIVVLPPPDNSGQPPNVIELLLVDPAKDLANFWSTAKSKIELAERQFVEMHQMPNMPYR
jgi:hypothetical protein